MDPGLLSALMGWAVVLSGLPQSIHMPNVVVVTHHRIEEIACGGKSCQVLGWFPPGETIYLDDRLEPLDQTYSSGIVVHELVHYLQQESAPATPGHEYSCATLVYRERQAYAVQRAFMTAYGSFAPIVGATHFSGCETVINNTRALP